MESVFHVFACALGWMFLLSGGLKVRSHRDFLYHLASLRVAPPWACKAASVLVPASEIAIGGLLLLASNKAPALLAGLVMLCAFTAYVAWLLASDREVSCFCFGNDEEPTTRLTLYRNMLLLGTTGGLLALWDGSVPLSTPLYWLGAIHGATTLLVFLSAMQILTQRALLGART